MAPAPYAVFLLRMLQKRHLKALTRKKNCKLKKRKRKQRSTFSFRKKVMLMTVTTTTTLHSRFTIFLKRNFGEIFAPWLFQEFIYWHCLHSHRIFIWRRAWKSERNLNLLWTESESKCVFTFLSMFNIWWFSGWFPWNTENCDGLRRSVKRYLFTSVTHTGQTYVFKIANFHCWNIVMSKNFKIIHFSFGAISWKLSEKFENVKQKNVIRNFDHVSWEKTFLSPDLGYTYLPMTVCLIKLKERKRLSSDEMLTVCTYVLYILW